MLRAVLDSFRGKALYFFGSSLIFFAGCFLGWLVFWQNPTFVLDNLDKLLGNLVEIGKKLEGAGKLAAAGYIFYNNAKALLVMIFGGVVFGIIPLFNLLFNGIVVGVVLAMNLYHGQSLSFFLAGILPHGMLELPAIWAGAAFGLKTGVELFNPKGMSRLDRLKDNLRGDILALGLLIPVLLVAALVEALVTPAVMNWFW